MSEERPSMLQRWDVLAIVLLVLVVQAILSHGWLEAYKQAHLNTEALAMRTLELTKARASNDTLRFLVEFSQRSDAGEQELVEHLFLRAERAELVARGRAQFTASEVRWIDRWIRDIHEELRDPQRPQTRLILSKYEVCE